MSIKTVTNLLVNEVSGHLDLFPEPPFSDATDITLYSDLTNLYIKRVLLLKDIYSEKRSLKY